MTSACIRWFKAREATIRRITAQHPNPGSASDTASRKAVTISVVSRNLRHDAVYAARNIATVDDEACCPLASHKANDYRDARMDRA